MPLDTESNVEFGQSPQRIGPLAGIRVVDVSALGPGPFSSMMLADFGADVISIRKPGPKPLFDPSEGMMRGKKSFAVDMKTAGGLAFVRRLCLRADVFLESGRPGVMERLGLGPAELMAHNPGLVYSRLTGWGQSGPYAKKAGHDINYLAVSGALGISGEDRPSVPPAIFGDIANGSYLAAFGVVMALFDRVRTGLGQVVDTAIMAGAASGLAGIFHERFSGQFSGRLGEHVLSGKAPFYGTYLCADGKWYSVGAIEPKFYAALLSAMGLDHVDKSPSAQWDVAAWPSLRQRIAGIFATASRDEWTRRLDPFDACTAPVLDIGELANDLHIAAQKTVVVDGTGRLQSAPAPRLSAYDGADRPGLPSPSSAEELDDGWQFSGEELSQLIAAGAIAV